jgi:hypothetical protein
MIEIQCVFRFAYQGSGWLINVCDYGPYLQAAITLRSVTGAVAQTRGPFRSRYSAEVSERLCISAR